MDKARLDHKAATQLQGRGFESETRVASTKASLDAAQARVAAAQQELERTIVRAPISGVVQAPLAEKGQMLSVGGTCATIVDADPMIFTGEVAERDIADLALGTPASVTLITGETVEGEVSYISRTADSYTRTFTVEITLPNPDGALRTGVTAKATIPLGTIRAHSFHLVCSPCPIRVRSAFAPSTTMASSCSDRWRSPCRTRTGSG